MKRCERLLTGLVLLASAALVALAAPVAARADTVGPIISGTTPANGAAVVAPVALKAHAADGDLIDADRTAFFLDGAKLATPAVAWGGYWEGDGCDSWWVEDDSQADFAVDVPALGYGPHTVMFRTYDRLGNLSYTSWTIFQSVSVTFANQLPRPGSRSRAVSHVEVGLSAASIATETVAMSIDGAAVNASYVAVDGGHGRVMCDGPLGDGTHTVTVSAGDGSALTTTTWSFGVDHLLAGPTLSAMAPADGAAVQGAFTVSVHATSTAGVNGAGSRLYVDGVPYGPSAVMYATYWVDDGCSSYLVEDRTQCDLAFAVPDNLPAGPHTLVLDVYDQAGLDTTILRTVVRSAHLSFAVQTPAEGSRQRSVDRVQVSVTGSDTDPATIVMLIDGTPVVPLWLPTGPEAGDAVYLGPLPEGPHTVLVSASDLSNAPAATTRWSFFVDTIGPSLLPVPADGATISDAASGITLISSDIDQTDPNTIVIRCDGVTLTPTVTNSIDATALATKWSGILAEGPHVLSASAADYSGITSTLTWNVTVADPPRFGTPSPAPGGLGGSTTRIRVPVSDVNDALDVGYGAVLTLDGANVPAVLTYADEEHATVGATATPLANGPHDAVLTVRDVHGHFGRLAWTFNVDVGGPAVVPGSASPSPGATLAASLVAGIGARFTDAHGIDLGVTTATLDGRPFPVSAVNDGKWVDDGCSGTFIPDPKTLIVGALSDPTLSDGIHTVVVKTGDQLGNASTYSWSFVVAEYPAIRSVQPVRYTQSASPTFTVGATFSDFDGIMPGSVSIMYRLADFGSEPGQWQPVLTGANGGTVTRTFVAPLPESRYEFLFSATDVSGHTTTATTDYYVASSKPTMQTGGSCTTCHTTIFTTHRMSDCYACHGDTRGPCSCHGIAMHPASYLDHAMMDGHGGPFTGRTCADCHSHNPQQEAQRHLTTGFDTCGLCHSRSLTTEHQGRKDSSGNDLTCMSCHGSDQTNVKTAIASGNADCRACHFVGPAGNHLDQHAEPPIAQDCFACHERNIVAEHLSNTRTQNKTLSCDTCHANADASVKDAIASGSSDCAGCHPTSHGDLAALHSPADTSSQSCTLPGCHGSGDVIALHKGRAEGGCAVCHANPTKGDLTEGTPTAACAGCHKTPGADYHVKLSTHVTSAVSADSCGRCHHVWGAVPGVRGPDVTQHPGGCKTCHNGAIDTTSLTTECRSCHKQEGTDYHTQAERAHTAQDADSYGCARCHETTDVQQLHAGVGCRVCHGAYSCGECHVLHGAVPSRLLGVSCTRCHKASGTGYHRDFQAKHTFSGMDTGCRRSGCHTSDLVATHQPYVGPSSPNPQYADTCGLCHMNDDPARVPKGATPDCSSCHAVHPEGVPAP